MDAMMSGGVFPPGAWRGLRSRPSSTIWTIFSSIVLPIPDSSFRLPVDGELRDRAAGLAHALSGAAVRERAELVAALELEEVGQQVELVGDVGVAWKRLRHPRDDMGRAPGHLSAHLRRAREPGADGARARRPWAWRGSTRCWSSTTRSPDGTGEIADRLAAELHLVHVLHREAQGWARARVSRRVPRARSSSGADFVFEMDCDFSHDLADVPRLAAATEEADLVLGSRYVAGGGTRELGLRAALHLAWRLLYAQVLLGLGIRDLTGGFKCYRRVVLETIDLDAIDSRGYAFQIEHDVPGDSRRVPRCRGPDHVLRPRGGRLEDQQVDRPRGDLGGPPPAPSRALTGRM